MTGFTFDAGGLIALDRNDRRVLSVIARATEVGLSLTVLATALAQAIRNPSGQVRLRRLIRQPGTKIVALDEADATAAGLQLARTGTANIVDFHADVCAQRARHIVVASDAGDLRRIAPELNLIPI
jgi:hypothetical protein